MTRSIWKGPFVEWSVLQTALSVQRPLWSRKSTVLPQFVGNKVTIHNGKSFVAFTISEEMVGHKFGEFAMTRKRAIHKKKVKKKK